MTSSSRMKSKARKERPLPGWNPSLPCLIRSSPHSQRDPSILKSASPYLQWIAHLDKLPPNQTSHGHSGRPELELADVSLLAVRSRTVVPVIAYLVGDSPEVHGREVSVVHSRRHIRWAMQLWRGEHVFQIRGMMWESWDTGSEGQRIMIGRKDRVRTEDANTD